VSINARQFVVARLCRRSAHACKRKAKAGLPTIAAPRAIWIIKTRATLQCPLDINRRAVFPREPVILFHPRAFLSRAFLPERERDAKLAFSRDASRSSRSSLVDSRSTLPIRETGDRESTAMRLSDRELSIFHAFASFSCFLSSDNHSTRSINVLDEAFLLATRVGTSHRGFLAALSKRDHSVHVASNRQSMIAFEIAAMSMRASGERRSRYRRFRNRVQRRSVKDAKDKQQKIHCMYSCATRALRFGSVTLSSLTESCRGFHK